jgi:small-conductance mechanosensitive channel
MIDLLAVANTVSELFAGPIERTAATLAVLIAAGAVTLLTRQYGERMSEVTRPVVTDVVTTMLYLGALAAATLLSAAIWDRIDLVYGVLNADALDAYTVPRLVVTGVVIVVSRVVVGFVRRIISRLETSNSGVDRHEGEVLEYVAVLVLYTTAGIVLLGVWNFDLEGLLIGAGFLGIVVGMAARQSLGAVFAGIVVMFSKPFEIGDWIVVGDSEGIVQDISIVNTRIRTFDGESVLIPNDRVNAQELTNRSYRERLRIELEVGVDYDADVERAREVAIDAMADVDLVLETPDPRAVGKRFGDSAVVLGVRYWIDNPTADRMWRANTAVIQSVRSAFEASGIEIPFPQRSLSGRDGAFQVAADGPVASSGPARAEESDGGRTSPGGSADE